MKRWNILLLAALATAVAQSSAQQLILDGKAIDLDPNLPVTIEEDGDIVAFSAAGDLTCANVTTPPTVALTASPSSITGSGDVTVSWTTQFADTCTPTGGGATNWSSTSITPLASGQTTLTDVSATATFTLSCDNVLGTSQDSASVTVSTGGSGEYAGFPPPADCPTTQPPPTGTSHQNPLEVFAPGGRTGASNNFEGAFGEGWPGISNSNEDIYIRSGNWLALGFIAEQAASCTGGGIIPPSVRVEWETSILPDGPKVVTISRCPGDFSTSLGSCRANFFSLQWSYGSGTGCVLTQGQQYYLNVIHGNNANPAMSTCNLNECGAFLTVR